MNRSRSGPRSLDRPRERRRHPVAACVRRRHDAHGAERRRSEPGRRARPPRRAGRDADPGHRHPRAVAAGPGPNGGTVVRWFVGLGAGTQPAAPRAREGLGRRRTTPRRRTSTSRSRSSTTRSRRGQLKTADRRRQRAGHHRPGRHRGTQPLPRPAARPRAARRVDRLHASPASTRSSPTSSRSARAAPRSACRSPSIRPSSSTTRTSSTRPSCPTRRPRSATCTRASRGTWTPSASSA